MEVRDAAVQASCWECGCSDSVLAVVPFAQPYPTRLIQVRSAASLIFPPATVPPQHGMPPRPDSHRRQTTFSSIEENK